MRLKVVLEHKTRVMRKCAILFAILVITLLVAAFIENTGQRTLIGDTIVAEENNTARLLAKGGVLEEAYVED